MSFNFCKGKFLTAILFACSIMIANNALASLGTYPAASVTLSGNVSVTPSSAPSAGTVITFSTSVAFTGIITTDSITGIVKITNAKPAGTYTITINGGIGIMESFVLTVNNPACSRGDFASAGTQTLAGVPVYVAVGEFNSDGNQDYLVANSTGNNVSIRLGNGSGGFTGSTNITVGTRPVAVVVGDFNRDNKQDFATANQTGNNLSIGIGNGAGGFTITNINSGGTAPNHLAIGDFNKDGFQDLVVANTNSNNISTLIGNGFGGFSAPTTSATNTAPRFLVIGDFNADGIEDVAITHPTTNAVSTKQGNGSGGWITASVLGALTSPTAIAVADINNDGKQDLLIGSGTGASSTCAVRLGVGNGTFNVGTSSTYVNQVLSIAPGDFNADGNIDIALSNLSSGFVSIRFGTGTGTFTGAATLTSALTNSIALGDFNNDGKQDLVSVSNTPAIATVYTGAYNVEINVQGNGISIPDGSVITSTNNNTSFGITNPGFAVPKSFTIQNTSLNTITVSNINITGANAGDFTLSGITLPVTLVGNTSVNFNVTFLNASAGTSNAVIHILNNDCASGDFDFAISGVSATPFIGSYPNSTVIEGGNIVVSPVSPPANVTLSATTTTDFQGLLTVNSTTGNVYVTNARPAGNYNITLSGGGLIQSFQLSVDTPHCSPASLVRSPDINNVDDVNFMEVADFDNDNIQDFVAIENGSTNVLVKKGIGNGTFTNFATLTSGGNAWGATVRDINRDGYADILIPEGAYNSVRIYLNNNGTAFYSSYNLNTGGFTYDCKVADINGDNIEDLVVAKNTGISIYYNDGFGNFTTGPFIPLSGAFKLAIADFNMDGKTDIAVSNFTTSIYVTLGNGAGVFSPLTSFTASNTVYWLYVMDYNHDSKPDIIGSYYSNIYSFTGNGSGSFIAGSIGSGFDSKEITGGDVNGDGFQDLICVGAYLLGNANGSFDARKDFVNNVYGLSVAAGDFNSDGRADVLLEVYGPSKILVFTGGSEPIDVFGKGVKIINGSISTSSVNNTDFGQIVTGVKKTSVFYLKNPGADSVIINSIILTGPNAAEFSSSGITFPYKLQGQDSIPFTISCQPTTVGNKTCNILINNSQCSTTDFTFALSGTGANAAIGTYPNVTMRVGRDSVIASTNFVFNNFEIKTSPSFTGQIFIDPSNGALRIVNAGPIGIYNVTISGAGGISTSFVLTVNKPDCSPATFNEPFDIGFNLSITDYDYGDFNNDGNIDFVYVGGAGAPGQIATGGVMFSDGSGNFPTQRLMTLHRGLYMLKVADYNRDGYLDFAAISLYDSLLTIHLGDGLGNFFEDTVYHVVGSPNMIKTADVNGDGAMDLLISYWSMNIVSVFVNNGSGNFTPGSTVTNSSYIQEFIVSDYNKDGKADFATAGYAITIYTGNGNGSFAQAGSFTLPSVAYDFTMGDFNGDGHEDFAAVFDSTSGSPHIMTAIYTGPGTYSANAFSIDNLRYRDINVGDFNGDGFDDLICSPIFIDKQQILLSDGNGSFSGSGKVNMGSSFNFRTADLNKDNILDMQMSGCYNNSCGFKILFGNKKPVKLYGNANLINDGSITTAASNQTDFGTVSTLNPISKLFRINNYSPDTLIINSITFTGTNAASFSVSGITLPYIFSDSGSVNFNIVCTSSVAGVKDAVVHVNYSSCSGSDYTFAIKATSAAVSVPNYPTTYVATGNDTTIAPITGTGGASTLTVSTSPTFKGLITINSAGLIRVTNPKPTGMHIVTVKYGSVSNTFVLFVTNSNCANSFATGTQIDTALFISSMTVCDFNNDGKQDLVIGKSLENAANATRVKFGNGQGGFPTTFNITTGTSVSSVAAGDFNNDGNQDIASVLYNQNKVLISLGNGSGGVSTTINVNVGTNPNDIYLSDFNLDGRLDFMTINAGSNNASVRLGAAGNTFTNGTDITGLNIPRHIDGSDLNQDGKIDLIITNSTGDATKLIGNGNGTFTPSIQYVTPPVNDIVIGDYNGDGFVDLAYSGGPSYSYYNFGNGTGSYNVGDYIGKPGYENTSNDMNGDGFSDVVTTERTASRIYFTPGEIGMNGTYFWINTLTPSTSIVTGEFNNDGRLDLITANGDNNEIILYKGSGIQAEATYFNTVIADGTTSTNLTDHTDFGNIAMGDSLINSFYLDSYIYVYNGLSIDSIKFTGPDASEFSVDHTYPYNGAFWLNIKCKANGVPGIKNATINIYLSSCDTMIYDFALKANVLPPPTIGDYQNIIVPVSADSSVIPTAAPALVNGLYAKASPSFKGVLTIDPVTGNITITNAYPAGTYTVTVGGTNVASKTFTITVNNAVCAPANFTATNFTAASGTISVALGDFNSDGYQDMATANNTASIITIRLGSATGFGAATNVQSGSGPTYITVCDLNQDGKQDLLVTLGNINVVNYIQGNGNGTFTPLFGTNVGSNPICIATGDFNNDGKIDVATANANSSNVSILLGDGQGFFSVLPAISTPSTPRYVVAGDFNNDGNTDLAIASQATGNNVTIRFGNGSGSFPTSTSFSLSGQPQSIVAGNFNGDNFTDLAFGLFNSTTCYVKLGDAAGLFTASAISVTTGNSVKSLSVGDFNSDGFQDIATANNSSGSVTILSGGGNGTFTSINTITVGTNPACIITGDVNRDGKQDLLVANQNSNNVTYLQANYVGVVVKGNSISIPDGNTVASSTNNTNLGQTFVGYPITKSFTIENGNRSSITLNGYTISGPDAANFTLTALPALPLQLVQNFIPFNITFNPSVSQTTYSATIHFSSNDCIHPDFDFLIQASVVQNPLGTYQNVTVASGSNTIVTPSSAPISLTTLNAVTSPDFRGIITVNPSTGIVRITNAYPAGTYSVKLKNNAVELSSFNITVQEANCSSGRFGNATNISSMSGANHVSVGDFNNDNIQDLLICNSTGGNVAVRLGNGTGGFTGSTSLVASNPFATAIADFNGDGNQDFAVTNTLSQTVNVFYGNGTGVFTPATSIILQLSGSNPAILAAADINNDGRMDLAITTQGSIVEIRLNNGAGGFTTGTNLVGGTPYSVAFSDFNVDGNADLLIGSNYTGAQKLQVCLGSGTGTFSNSPFIGVTGNNVRSIAVNDFNENGSSDFVSAQFAANDFALYSNNGTGTFTQATTGTTGSQPSYITSADINGNGFMDIIYANSGGNTITSRLGNGNATFQSEISVGTGTTPQCITVGDFNGDGIHDLATAYKGGNITSVQLGIKNAIIISGNGNVINDGATQPVVSNYTDFGPVIIGNNLSRSYSIQNPTASGITITTVNISGVHAGDFTVSGISLPFTIGAGLSASFNITFTPQAGFIRSATVQVNNDFCSSTTYSFNVRGIGCIPPSFSVCPSNMNVNAPANFCRSVVSYSVAFSGTHTPGTISYSLTGATTANGTGTGSGSTFNSGVTHVAITASDSCGSAACNFDVEVTAIITDNNACTTDACDVNGNVTHAPISTDDNNACTADGCNAVTGVFHNPINFDDNNVCTIDACDPVTGISYTPVNTDDGLDCTTDGCDPVTGIYHNSGTEICGNGIDDDCDTQIDEACSYSFQLKLFIEGFYYGNNLMRAVVDSINHPSLCDTVTVELRSSINTANVLYSEKVLVSTSGIADFTVPVSSITTPVYIVIFHRNAIETWSSVAVNPTGPVYYDFTDLQSRAFGNNLILTSDLMNYAIFSGDIISNMLIMGKQDGMIDHYDYAAMEIAINLTPFGYIPEDLSGDGLTESYDYMIMENNSFYAVIAIRP